MKCTLIDRGSFICERHTLAERLEQQRPKSDTCAHCGQRFELTPTGKLPAHSDPAHGVARCFGSGKRP